MTPPPDLWCCRTIELAVRVLPSEHRQRYGLEFIAELYGMPRGQQRRHAARVLTSAWALRTALEAAPGGSQETAVLTIRRPLGCRLNLNHRWVWLSTEDGDRYERCRKCGKDRSEKVGGGPHVGAASTGTIW
jgi:hypothetical protein